MIVVFKDRKPAAKHHYLVCPREHIRDAKALTHKHLPLVDTMVGVGRQVLEEAGGDFSSARVGFHWPPFCSIYHLHLHVICNEEDTKPVKHKWKYNSKMFWFKTVDWILKRLEVLTDDS